MTPSPCADPPASCMPTCGSSRVPDAGARPRPPGKTWPADRPEYWGSAPVATRGWLLIEHPGPWPAFGHPSDLPPHLAQAADRLLAQGVRPQLIRRTDRPGRRGDGVRAVFLVGGTGDATDPGSGENHARGGWIERVDPGLLTGRQAAGRLSDALLRSEGPPGLGRPCGPLLLVCTHGRREVCCARYGRPVAVALAARFGPLVWETTHVGGDQFAANLVLLPQGTYFGRLLDPRRAVDVAERALSGQLDADAYRGTAGRSAAAQIAERHLRQLLGEFALAAVQPLHSPVSGGREAPVHRFVHARPDGSRAYYQVRVQRDAGSYRLASITSAG